MSSFGFSCSANGRSFAALRISTLSASTSTVPVRSLSFTDRRLGGVLALHHHLRQALVVAQVDEGHMGLQADLVDPTAQGDGLADQRLVDEAAVMRAHALGTPGRSPWETGGKTGDFSRLPGNCLPARSRLAAPEVDGGTTSVAGRRGRRGTGRGIRPSPTRCRDRCPRYGPRRRL